MDVLGIVGSNSEYRDEPVYQEEWQRDGWERVVVACPNDVGVEESSFYRLTDCSFPYADSRTQPRRVMTRRNFVHDHVAVNEAVPVINMVAARSRVAER